MRLVYITLARKILCYGSFPAKVLLGTNAYNFLILFLFLIPLPFTIFQSQLLVFLIRPFHFTLNKAVNQTS